MALQVIEMALLVIELVSPLIELALLVIEMGSIQVYSINCVRNFYSKKLT